MMSPKTQHASRSAARSLPKCPTGIQGFDDITGGGVPRGRPTLVCGMAGCGKTLLAMQFLVRGATDYHEPGVFMAFEENADELTKNVASLGFDLPALIRHKQLCVDYVHVERSEIEETGEYDLEALFVRLGHAIDSIGARRVVLDTVEALFGALPNTLILRAELRRLFRWLKDKGVTAMITAEQGGGTLTRYGLEEYVSDCVVRLDHRLTEQVSTRRLHIVKYRGSAHGTNEYPFLINERGFFILPITSLGVQHPASTERVSTGLPQLDTMLSGRGYFRGSTVLISGTAGTGKTSVAAHFAEAACRRGERCLYFAFEESMPQVTRNMQSIGLNLRPWLDKGRLRFHASRPTLYGLEEHLATMGMMIDTFHPHVLVIDPLTNFLSVGKASAAKAMLVRLLDTAKQHQITTVCTSLTTAGDVLEGTAVDVSSLVDTWLLLRDIELNGERNRGLYILKSRGMAHSNQICDMLITDHGIELLDIQRDLDRRRAALDAQIGVLRAEYDRATDEMQNSLAELQQREQRTQGNRAEARHQRKADVAPTRWPPPKVRAKGGRR